MNRLDSLRREKETDSRTLFTNAAKALNRAQQSLLDSKEAVALLGNKKAADLLEQHLHFATELKWHLRDRYSQETTEEEAAKIFELPLEPRCKGRPPLI